MSEWTLTRPPRYKPTAVATTQGWVDPETGEVLVAIRNLSGKSASTIVSLTLNASAYKVGDSLTVAVRFSEAVTVTGTPQLTINFNAQARTLDYASGSGTPTLVFGAPYTVATGDTAAAGLITFTSPIALNSGTMKDTAQGTVNSVRTFAAGAYTNTAVVDATLPTLTSVTRESHATDYVTGDQIILDALFSEAMVVTGSPRIPLTITSGAKNATYLSGSGTTTLKFAYTLVSGDHGEATGVSVGSPIALNSGTIKDLAGNSPAALTFTPPTITTVTFNAVPTLTSVTRVAHANAYVTGNTISFDALFSRAVDVAGAPTIVLGITSGNKVVTYASGTGTNTLRFSYVLVGGDSAVGTGVTLPSPIVLGTGITIKDHVTLADATPITFTPPTLTAITFN